MQSFNPLFLYVNKVCLNTNLPVIYKEKNKGLKKKSNRKLEDVKWNKYYKDRSKKHNQTKQNQTKNLPTNQ